MMYWNVQVNRRDNQVAKGWWKMGKINNVRSLMNQNKIFVLYLLLLAILNMAYVSIEVYKAKISEPLLVKGEITKLEFLRLETLSSYTSYFESTIIVLMFISVFLVCTKKYRHLLRSFIAIHLAYLVTFLLLGNALSWIFVAPVGNLTQQLIFPFILILGVLFYFIINSSSKNLIVDS